MAVAVGILNEVRRRTLEAICDTFAPAVAAAGGEDEPIREFLARSAGDLGVAEQIESLLGSVMVKEEVDALGGLLDGFDDQDIAGRPVADSTRVVPAGGGSAPG